MCSLPVAPDAAFSAGVTLNRKSLSPPSSGSGHCTRSPLVAQLAGNSILATPARSLRRNTTSGPTTSAVWARASIVRVTPPIGSRSAVGALKTIDPPFWPSARAAVAEADGEHDAGDSDRRAKQSVTPQRPFLFLKETGPPAA
jgi:hypothetical protein